MALIVNLSTTHNLKPIDDCVSAFAQLIGRYGQPSRFVPGLFSNWTNEAWVKYQYWMQFDRLIKPYKLGQIDTPTFLANLLKIFSFLDRPDLLDKFAKSPSIKGNLYSTEMADPKAELYALLEVCWNKQIELETDRQGRFAQLVEAAKTEPVYLISNTNELHVHRLLSLLRMWNKDVSWKEVIDISVRASDEPIEIAPNIFLCLSYRFQMEKSPAAQSTPSLIRSLCEKLPAEEKVTLVSDYALDYEAANAKAPTCMKSDEYFHASLPQAALS